MGNERFALERSTWDGKFVGQFGQLEATMCRGSMLNITAYPNAEHRFGRCACREHV